MVGGFVRDAVPSVRVVASGGGLVCGPLFAERFGQLVTELVDLLAQC